MTSINISVYHIIHFTELIDKSFWSFEKLLASDFFRDNKNEDVRKMIFMNMTSQILIYTDSLRDEFYNHFNIKKADTEDEISKIEEISEVLKPVFQKINEWRDIKNFSNHVLAHNLRIEKNGATSVFIDRGISGYNIPERIADFAFLIKCTYLIKKVVYDVFEKEYIIVDEEINSEKYAAKPLLTERDYDKEYKNLINDIVVVQANIKENLSKR